MKLIIFSMLATFLISSSSAQTDFSQGRGLNRDGKYPDKNLLKKWPEEGPNLLWQTDHIGVGHTSAAVTKDRIYITGMQKKEGVLHCFDLEGNKLWESTYGPEWFKN